MVLLFIIILAAVLIAIVSKSSYSRETNDIDATKIPSQDENQDDYRLLSTTTYDTVTGKSYRETYGFYLETFLKPETPLHFLQRHGEAVDSLPYGNVTAQFEHGRWVQRTKAEKDAGRPLGGIECFNYFGNMASDGGDLLRYLIQARKLIESPLPQENTFVEIINRIEKLKVLPKGHRYHKSGEIDFSKDKVDYYPLLYKSEDYSLRIIFDAQKLSPYLYVFSHENITHLVTLGITSIERIKQAPDKILLSLKGIGPKKLEKLRLGLS
tara:strand:+ start:25155 stop:25958 length:804 start_codon:yes stop_codon:yes gene_type:complete